MQQVNQEAAKQQIREATDIVRLISGYVALKKTGQNWVGLCPFHSEKTGSFNVNASRQIFHCFGCGAHGDVFKFIMLREGLPFPDAVRELGRQAGIAVPAPGELSREDPDADLVRINEAAKDYFHKMLLKDPGAEKARAYLKSRDVSPDSVEAFSIGYAPPGSRHCSQFLERMGFNLSRIERAGLVGANRSGGGFYERFRDRLVFPVLNARGECVAFGGRVLGPEGVPKYLNSPETPVYVKSKILFAFDRAIKEKSGSIVIVEGYFDAVRAHEAGIRNAVATCGTALTPSHIQQIRRAAGKVYLIFDPDPAGVRAAKRTAELFLGTGFPAYVVILPEGLDPDLFIRKEGRSGFEEALKKAVRLFDFVLQESLRKYPNRDLEGKQAVLKEILPLVQNISGGVERSHYVSGIARELSVPESDILQEMSRMGKRRPETVQGKKTERSGEKLPQKEEYVLRFLLSGKVSPSQILNLVGPDDFTDNRAVRVMTLLSQEHLETDILAGTEILDRFTEDPATSELLSELFMKEPDYDFPVEALEDSVKMLIQERYNRKRSKLVEIISAAEKAKDSRKVEEHSRLLSQIRVKETTEIRVKF